MFKEMLSDIYQGTPHAGEIIRLQTASRIPVSPDITGSPFFVTGFAGCAVFSCRESEDSTNPHRWKGQDTLFALFNHLPGMIYRCFLMKNGPWYL